MITTVTYARLYNLGNYENEKLEVTVSVKDGDVTAARITAVATVESEHTRMVEERRAVKYQPLPTPITMPAPASQKQRAYIARLQDDLGWTSEELATCANEQKVDLVEMTLDQASRLINAMKQAQQRQPPNNDPNDLPF